MAKNFGFVSREHLSPAASVDQSKRLFKRSVQMVEVEVFSYCNRRCAFCPNSTIDRFSNNILMDVALYEKLLSELEAVGYSETISYSRYNEPLADKIILERLRQAKERLPKVKLHMNTNGDYLNQDYIQELYEAGLRSLKIQSYLLNHEQYDDQLVVERITKKLELLGLPYRFTTQKSNDICKAKIAYRDMDIQIYSRNFEKNGCNRGGLVDIRSNYLRKSPCLSPFRDLYIDYNGSVMPCCNLRSDSEKHQPYIVGNIKDSTIFEIYAAGPLVEWRKALIGFGPKKAPCSNCSFSIQKKDLPYLFALFKAKQGLSTAKDEKALSVR